ncbi:MAG: DNA-binding domain-containing protein [Kofleriaceae bacterium]
MPSSLAELQRRFHDAVTGDRIPEESLDVVRADGVSPRRRLDVYFNAYRIRIHDAIAAEFPKVSLALGPERFGELCRRYLAKHPTSRPSLRDAAQHLAAFVRGGGWPPAPSWLADLAALERARTDAFDGPEARPLTREDLAQIPPEEIAFLRLPLVPTASILELHSIADTVWTALEKEQPLPEEPREAVPPRGVLVWRRDITVIHRTLADDEAEVLRALAAGATFADACELLVQHEDPPQRALQIILTALDGAAFVAPSEPLAVARPLPEDLGELT